MRLPGPPQARLAWVVTLVGAVGFGVVAALLVPWQPVPGGMPDPVPAREVFTAAQIARAEDFARLARALSWTALVISLLVAALLGFTPRGARLLDLAPGAVRRRWPLAVVFLVAVVLLIGRLATLVPGVLLQRQRLANDLSNQAWGDWALDQLRGYGVAVVATSIALLVLVGCARRWPRWWPVIAAGLSALLVLAGSFLYPLLVEPVFNNFHRMPDGQLRTEILRLADQEGVTVDDVLVADASRRTTTLNAYVSGFGSTRRVVVYDTLLDSQPEGEVLSVVAHELAHARHDDVVVGTVLGAFGAVVGVGVLGVLLASPGLRRRAGVTGLGDPRSVALVLALLAVGTLLSSPVQNGISRRIETRADVDALETTQDPESFIALQRALALRSLADPSPPAWSQFWFGSHPTALERIAVARSLPIR
ncbi:M48 family peptidase [Nocardioides guangzhouensis]|uniref:M48 family peptidase n=1 Tax=Nocardioides guangzhouensis TaxID=2497878 RepID=A0A4Q4ZEK4_9ACTN|nr:M48 family metallopeptidase [Nocardioides guangzhouensis]RYP85664.1 M48 family peptidase [Nocardioides guangzhouensis]